MTLSGTNTWLIDGAQPALIDAGIGDDRLIEAIAAHLGGRPLARVIVTHGHGDHASGVAALRRRWPALEACKWPLGGEQGWRAVRDAEWLDAGDGRLQVLHTPGHAADHICLWDPSTGDLFSGDMLILGTTVMIPAGRGGGLRAYLESLDRMAVLAPRRIYPGHGDVIDDPQAVIRHYQQHRRERDAQVRACLAEGLTTADQIVARLYRGLPASMLPAARMTIQAHLDMLNHG